MKILIIGSDSLHVKNYIDELLKLNYQVCFISEKTFQFEFAIKEKEVSFKSKNPFTLLQNYYKIKRYIKQFAPDVVHVHQINRLGFVAVKVAKTLKSTIVSTAWGSDVLVIPFINVIYFYITKYILKNSIFVTADSQSMIDAMNKVYFSNEKYILLQYGITIVESIEKEKIIFSNRMHKSLYRIIDIIHYFEDFSKENPDWKLIIGGTGEETEIYIKVVDELRLNSKVIFTNWLNQSENHKWYSKSKIYISIPESDGTSVSVLEAMSAGCIPVLSDLPVSHEWVKNNYNGIIETKGLNPLKEALKLNFDVAKIENKNLVTEKASREVCIAKFIELYQKSLVR